MCGGGARRVLFIHSFTPEITQQPFPCPDGPGAEGRGGGQRRVWRQSCKRVGRWRSSKAWYVFWCCWDVCLSPFFPMTYVPLSLFFCLHLRPKSASSHRKPAPVRRRTGRRVRSHERKRRGTGQAAPSSLRQELCTSVGSLGQNRFVCGTILIYASPSIFSPPNHPFL